MDDGTVKIVKTNALDSFTIESSSQFHLLGDGSRALITDEHGTSWFLVGIDGTDKKITPPSFKGRTIFSEYPVADTNRTLFFTAPTPSEAELEESPITFLLRSFKDMGSHLKPNDNHKLKRDNTTILAVNSEGDAHEITFPVVASLTGHTLSPRGHYLWSILEEEKVQHIYLTDLQKGSSTELTLPPHPFFKIPILNNERIFPNEESRQAVFTDFPKTDFYLLNAEKSPVELIRVSLGSEYKGIFDWQIANTHAFLMAKRRVSTTLRQVLT